MTQIFNQSGDVIPVTKVQAGPCQVIQIKNSKETNANALELGFENVKEFRLNKPKAGHLKGMKPLRHLFSFSTDKIEGINRGDEITVDTFVIGDKVDVEGVSKGKGFAGVVKRHHFAGGPASHGHKDNLRAPGSIGAGGVQRVFKGTRMAGQMGDAQVTIQNLEIIEINAETNELFIKGAVPGGRNSILKIYSNGDLIIKKEPISVPEKKEEIALEKEQEIVDIDKKEVAQEVLDSKKETK